MASTPTPTRTLANTKLDGKTVLTLKLTVSELELLTSLASDQLFRREFIDPKIPGYKSNSTDLSLGKALVGKLRLLVDPSYAKKIPATRVTA